MTAEEAARQANAEGLTLLQSPHTDTGYFGVHTAGGPYKAEVVSPDGKKIYLGFFGTPQEAALAVARTPEGQAAAMVATLAMAVANINRRRWRAICHKVRFLVLVGKCRLAFDEVRFRPGGSGALAAAEHFYDVATNLQPHHGGGLAS